MKNKIFDLTDRVLDSEIDVGEYDYRTGLFLVTKFLLEEFKTLMGKEGRYIGIVKSYTNAMDQAYQRIEFEDIGGRILYLLKPVLRAEFKRLQGKRLSAADSNICIIRKLLSIILEEENFVFVKEARTAKRIIDRLYDNIRTPSKKDAMFFMGDIVRRCMMEGALGKYSAPSFTYLPKPGGEGGDVEVILYNNSTEIDL